MNEITLSTSIFFFIWSFVSEAVGPFLNFLELFVQFDFLRILMSVIYVSVTYLIHLF